MASAHNRPTDPNRPGAIFRSALMPMLGSKTQREFELAFFGAILRRHPYNPEALRVQAGNLAALGRHHEAFPLDKRILALEPDSSIAWYNIACDLSMLGQVDEAFRALAKAVELGYPRLDHLRRDPELRNLHNDPRFARLIALCG